jgi:hypothetical protein
MRIKDPIPGVIPAKAGIQSFHVVLDPSFCEGDNLSLVMQVFHLRNNGQKLQAYAHRPGDGCALELQVFARVVDVFFIIHIKSLEIN